MSKNITIDLTKSSQSQQISQNENSNLQNSCINDKSADIDFKKADLINEISSDSTESKQNSSFEEKDTLTGIEPLQSCQKDLLISKDEMTDNSRASSEQVSNLNSNSSMTLIHSKNLDVTNSTSQKLGSKGLLGSQHLKLKYQGATGNDYSSSNGSDDDDMMGINHHTAHPVNNNTDLTLEKRSSVHQLLSKKSSTPYRKKFIPSSNSSSNFSSEDDHGSDVNNDNNCNTTTDDSIDSTNTETETLPPKFIRSTNNQVIDVSKRKYTTIEKNSTTPTPVRYNTCRTKNTNYNLNQKQSGSGPRGQATVRENGRGGANIPTSSRKLPQTLNKDQSRIYQQKLKQHLRKLQFEVPNQDCIDLRKIETGQNYFSKSLTRKIIEQRLASLHEIRQTNINSNNQSNTNELLNSDSSSSSPSSTQISLSTLQPPKVKIDNDSLILLGTAFNMVIHEIKSDLENEKFTEIGNEKDRSKVLRRVLEKSVEKFVK